MEIAESQRLVEIKTIIGLTVVRRVWPDERRWTGESGRETGTHEEEADDEDAAADEDEAEDEDTAEFVFSLCIPEG